METRFYQAQGLDIERIALELEGIFIGQGYQVQHFGKRDHTVVQVKKGGDFAAIVGMQTALTLTLQSAPGGVMAILGQQRWADKAAAGAVGILILWPLAFTAGAGAIMQSNLASQMLNALDAVARRQQANVRSGPIPPHLWNQLQQQMASSPPYQQQASAQAPAGQPMPFPPQAPSFPQQTPPWQSGIPRTQNVPDQAFPQIPCVNCQSLNDSDDKFCSRCGKPLGAQKMRCAHCEAENKPGAAFCTSCGTSFSSPASSPSADMTPKTQPLTQATPASVIWGYLDFAQGRRVALEKARITVGRMLGSTSEGKPDINLADMPEANGVSRTHALLVCKGESYILTDLGSTNLTRLNEQVVPPYTPTLFGEDDKISFGKVICTFRKM